MFVDLELTADQVLNEVMPEELAEGKRFRDDGKYLGSFLECLYAHWGIAGGHRWEAEIRGAVRDRLQVILVHSYINKVLSEDADDRLCELVEKFDKDLRDYIDEKERRERSLKLAERR